MVSASRKREAKENSNLEIWKEYDNREKAWLILSKLNGAINEKPREERFSQKPITKRSSIQEGRVPMKPWWRLGPENSHVLSIRIIGCLC